MAKCGYVKITFSKEAKEKLKNLLNKIVLDEEFYYSDAIEHIHGDVTDNSHFTLFFGLKESELEHPKLIEFVDGIELDNLEISELKLFDGYKGLYKVLVAEVEDKEGNLLNLSNNFLDFEYDPEMTHDEFKPHITLAYVRKDYVLPEGFNMNKLILDSHEIIIAKFEDQL
jgi:2'-5' RNA ligase